MAVPNMDQFEAYFKRADLDGDGRISGAEAVSSFKDPVCPSKSLLSKRDLTPDIVKAALYGPAAAKIPPPQINLQATAAAPQMAAASPVPQMGSAAPTTSQGFGFRGPGVPTAAPQMVASFCHADGTFPRHGQTMRPPQGVPPGTASRPTSGVRLPVAWGGSSSIMPAGTTPRPPQFMSGGSAGPTPRVSNPNRSSDWLGGRTGGTPTSPGGVQPSYTTTTSQPRPLSSVSSQPIANDSKVVSKWVRL
ncbi:hypothetical protein POTOM_060537 [Populus tomentosa]|uniref:EF-hand domain-containing protein n=1 Tax=Populus tomentosa TaxID=118781 RepID=A0A8X7XMU6_POPTO|nr:hypothetical protein POTOM_060537 [Populus tomentosa]